MANTIHTAKIRIVQKKRPLREAYVEGFPSPIRFGVHGGYASFYNVEPAEPLPTTIDHFISALGG
jgi:hypothetical protein